MLVDVVDVVGGREDLGLVDEIDPQFLKDLGLDEVSDAGLGHDGNGDRLNDTRDEVGVAHTGHTALSADVGRNALEGHDGDGSGILGDTGLLGSDDVHDDAALEHVGQTALDERGPGLRRLRGGCAPDARPHGVGGAVLSGVTHASDAASAGGLW